MQFNYFNEHAAEQLHEMQHRFLNESLTDLSHQMQAMHGELEMLANQMAEGQITNYGQEDLLMAWESFYY
jgi:hypothetical protein